MAWDMSPKQGSPANEQKDSTMIDYARRDSAVAANQATRNSETSVKVKLLTTIKVFPAVFTVIYLLNMVMEHASRHH